MLTRRERQIAHFIQEGLSNKEIAVALGLSISAVKWHVSNLLQKTGAENRLRLARLLIENNAVWLMPTGEEEEKELGSKLARLRKQRQRLRQRERLLGAVITACEMYLGCGGGKLLLGMTAPAKETRRGAA